MSVQVQNQQIPMDISPPPYSASAVNETVTDDGDEGPPPYTDVAKLPTYGEVEEMHRQTAIREMFNLSEDDFEYNDRSVSHHGTGEEDINIGTDFGFLACFFLSFVLNWIGFLMGYCLATSLAAQYGALSGFGLSLIKWALFLKHTNWFPDEVKDHTWIIWLLVIAGWITFLKGAISYVQLKRGNAARRYLIW